MLTTESATEPIRARIEELRDEMVELTAALVEVDSTNPTHPAADPAKVAGGESRCNEILGERYAAAGLEVHTVAKDPARRNLVGVRGGSGDGRSLILNGHVDTVPPLKPERWSIADPWTPEIRDGRMYGLGATDMKAAAAAMWGAAQAIADTDVELVGELQLHSVVGEEAMEHELGTSACIEEGFTADAALVCEPTARPSGSLSGAPASLAVAHVSPGYAHLVITVEGRATHCGNRSLAIRPGGLGDAVGVNALEKALLVVRALSELEQQWGLTKNHPAFPPGFFSMLPGILHADSGVEAIAPVYFPDSAQVEYSIWFPPDQTHAELVSEITEHVLTACRLDPWLREHSPRLDWGVTWPPGQIEWEHPLVQTVRGAYERVSGERVHDPSPQHPASFGASGDSTWYLRAGIPSLFFGPGNIQVAHGVDESVAIEEIVVAAQTLALAALEWCGVAAD